VLACGLHSTARCNRPWDLCTSQRIQQLTRSGERADPAAELLISLSMQSTEPLDPVRGDLHFGLAQQLMSEQTAAHPDLAMNPAHRQLDAFGGERFLPGEHVLVDTVHESTVQIEYEYGPDGHRHSGRWDGS